MIPVRGRPRVLFVKPALGFGSWPFSNDFIMRYVLRVSSSTFPALIGAVGADGVAMYDGVFERGATVRGVAELARDFPVVSLSVVSSLLALNTEVQIHAIKRWAPQTKIVLGGHHATFYPEQWVARGVDAVVRHEGERTFPEVAERLLSGQTPAGVAGVTWRDGESAVTETDRPLAPDLDQLPLPDWSPVDLRLYDAGLAPHGLSATIETARGCPHRCVFCAATAMWRNRQRIKSVDRVMTEVQRLYDRGVRQILIGDDNFGVHRARDLELFARLKPLGVALWAFVRADTIFFDPEWVAAATEAGLRMTLIGFENLNRDMLQRYEKGQQGDLGFAEYREVYRRLKAGGAFVYGLFVRDYDFSGDDAWPARRIAQVCDISAQTRFIPMNGVRGVEQLRAQGYAVKDMFYHDRFWPGFTRDGRPQENRFVGALIYDLLKPRNFTKMFWGTYVERTFLRRLYLGLFKDVFSVTPTRLKVAFIAALRRLSPQERQERIVRLALGKTR